MKFGGTSVGDPKRISQVTSIIERHLPQKPIIVVSALAGVTDRLLELAQIAPQGDLRRVERCVQALRRRHRAVVKALVKKPAILRSALQALDEKFRELSNACYGVLLLRELSHRSLDLISSFGERLSSRTLSAALEERGVPSSYVDARRMIVTSEDHGAAHVDFKQTDPNVRRTLRPLLKRRRVPVVCGFIGATRAGVTTTLGRSGSDYTAAILGAAMSAAEIQIWKEVDGVCTADPSLIRDARVVRHLSYHEAAEISHFGAKVVHPTTMLPAMRHNISIRIKNTFRPDGPGTVITARAHRSTPLILSSVDDVSLITVEGTGFIGTPGTILRVLQIVGSKGINIFMISMASSEYSLSFLVRRTDTDRAVKALEHELRYEREVEGSIRDILVESPMAVVAIVGSQMKGRPGISGRVFGALGQEGINVVAIAQGSSEYNISVIVRSSDMKRALQCIHKWLHVEPERKPAMKPRRLAARL
ncbi:MAG: aspartate kinase [Acidobacteria bacterium]|nr:aspartate kinase [Acidobacteriota bacterium]